MAGTGSTRAPFTCAHRARPPFASTVTEKFNSKKTATYTSPGGDRSIIARRSWGRQRVARRRWGRQRAGQRPPLRSCRQGRNGQRFTELRRCARCARACQRAEERTPETSRTSGGALGLGKVLRSETRWSARTARRTGATGENEWRRERRDLQNALHKRGADATIARARPSKSCCVRRWPGARMSVDEVGRGLRGRPPPESAVKE
jgi:hypothetical protein